MQETQEKFIDLEQVDVLEQVELSDHAETIAIPCMGIAK